MQRIKWSRFCWKQMRWGWVDHRQELFCITKARCSCFSRRLWSQPNITGSTYAHRTAFVFSFRKKVSEVTYFNTCKLWTCLHSYLINGSTLHNTKLPLSSPRNVHIMLYITYVAPYVRRFEKKEVSVIESDIFMFYSHFSQEIP